VDAEETFSMTKFNAWLWMKHKMLNMTFSDWNHNSIECLQILWFEANGKRGIRR